MVSPCVHIQIDGEEVSIGAVRIHAQRDPYPGGHDYCLSLPPMLSQEWISELGLARELPHEFDERLSWDGLYWLTSILTGAVRESIADPRYVINTIANVDSSKDGICIKGICSPFVNQPKNHGPGLTSHGAVTKSAP